MSSLEVHNVTMTNGKTSDEVSTSEAVLIIFPYFSAPIPGGTCNSIFSTEGPSTLRMEPLSSMIQPSTPTPRRGG
jgi:hypothetical protein